MTFFRCDISQVFVEIFFFEILKNRVIEENCYFFLEGVRGILVWG